MKLLKYALLTLLSGLFLFLFSCTKEDEKMTKNDFLIGKWEEKEPEEITQFSGTNYIIEFTQDSFFVARTSWTDAFSTENDCVNGHTDYYKGIYEIINDQISFIGKATNDQFVLATPPCDRPTNYEENFKFQKKNEQVLILNPDQEIYVQIRLLKE